MVHSKWSVGNNNRLRLSAVAMALAVLVMPLPTLADSNGYETSLGGMDFIADLPPKPGRNVETAQSQEEPPPPTAAPVPVVEHAPADDTTPPPSGEEVPTAAPGLPANAFAAEDRKEQELLILQMLLGDKILADGVFGYPKQGSLILPLSDVVSILEFPISVDPVNGRAEGWFIEENRLFSLDLEAGKVVIDGESRSINPSFLEQLSDDIYVDVRTLSQWFPIDIKFDLPNLILQVESREPLPIEARVARDLRRQKALAQRGKDSKNLPKVKVPYQWITWPVSDTAVDFTVSSGDDGAELSRSYTTIATADLAKLNADLFLSGTDEETIEVARLKLGRQDEDGGLLGKLDATQFAVGDVFGPQITHMTRTDVGRGVYVSNTPVGRQVEFDRITLQGDLQLGWEVELYRNEVLLDFRESQTDGRYLFEDVPLLFGVNVLKLVFYGPQGQVREDIRQIRVGPDQIKPGEYTYTVSALQQDRLLLMGDAESLNDDGFQGKNRLTAQFAAGMTQNLSVGMNMATIPFEGGHRSYVGTNAVTSLGSIFGRVDLTKDVSGGWAGTLSAQTSVFGVTVLGEHTILNDFVSEEYNETSDPLEQESRMRLDGVLRTGFLPHIPYAFNVTHEVSKSRNRTTTLQNRLSTAIGRASVSNTLDLTFNDPSEEEDTRTASGTVQIGGKIGPVRTRGQLAYNVDPEPAFTTAALSGDWNINRDYSARAGISRTLSGDQETTYTMGLNTDLDVIAVGIDGQYSDTGNYSGRMRLSYSWGKDAADGGLRLSSKQTAERGTILARVFLDLDGDGKFDKEVDEPLEGIRFRADRSLKEEKTNEKGLALVTALETLSSFTFEIDEGSLIDPFWIATPAAVQITLRPGVPGVVDFAVVSSGEIDGTVYRRNKEWSDPVSDVRMQLVDENGQVAKEVKSQFDGFYLIDFIRPGIYTLRIDPEQLSSLNLPDVPSIIVEIGSDGTILNGKNFIIGGPQPDAAGATLRVVLASFPTKADAMAAWEEISQNLPIIFKGVEPQIENIEDGGETGVTLFAEPFPDRQAAKDLCTDIRARFGNTWCNPLDIQIR